MKRLKELNTLVSKTECQQLHDKITLNPVDGTKLTKQQKKGDLCVLIFFNKKQIGKVNWRACVDGRKQRKVSKKSEATYPTVATEAVLINAVIYATEERYVAIVNAPGELLTSDMDEEVLLVIDNHLAEFMESVDPIM